MKRRRALESNIQYCFGISWRVYVEIYSYETENQSLRTGQVRSREALLNMTHPLNQSFGRERVNRW
jgi:hypothetical protein